MDGALFNSIFIGCLLIKLAGKLSKPLLRNCRGAFLGDVNCLFLLAGTPHIRMAKLTLRKGTRLVSKNSLWLSVTPYAAGWK